MEESLKNGPRSTLASMLMLVCGLWCLHIVILMRKNIKCLTRNLLRPRTH
uniref:Putative phospholipid-transporting ATPase 9 n=1 Tax=Rhizophora mucronata TaxID=61149 RepID=A0A2P2MIN4_RHIMU